MFLRIGKVDVQIGQTPSSAFVCLWGHLIPPPFVDVIYGCSYLQSPVVVTTLSDWPDPQRSLGVGVTAADGMVFSYSSALYRCLMALQGTIHLVLTKTAHALHYVRYFRPLPSLPTWK